MAPSWIITLDAARDWGCKPWEIAGDEEVLWYLRYKILHQERNQVTKEAREEDG